jgi:uncharacterized protein (TIGR02118 family)
MARLIVFYNNASDVAAFKQYYFEQHVPLAKKIPGLRKFETSQGPVLTPSGPSAYQLVATLHFDSVAAIQTAFASPEGQAAAADAQTLSVAQMLMFEDRMV